MKLDKIARDNHAFFFAAVGMALCSPSAKEALLQSLYGDGLMQYGIEQGEQSGYLRIDSTDIINQCSHGSLAERVREGVLAKVAMKIPYGGIVGDLNDKAEVIQGSYKFSFQIAQYERDRDHEFEMVDDPSLLPDDEQLGRLVEMKITIV